MVAIAGGGFAGGWAWWRDVLARPGPLPAAQAIVVPRGGSAQLTTALVSAGAIDRPVLFRIAVWLTRDDGVPHAAELAFPAHASIHQVLAILRSGHPVEHHLTIPEGLTARQIEAILANAEAAAGAVPSIGEGTVLPQTYDYEYGAERTAIAARATAAMDKALATAWADRAPGLALASPRDAAILASIVERETARPEERPHVAAVYLNRLRLGMKLQADPTVIYFASGGAGVLDHKLTRAVLGRDDPFNTYRNAGLPPAPICAPGLESVRAVLHPADSGDLYFVADGSGGHVFSPDYRTHEEAVTRWRALTAPAGQGRPDLDR